MEDFYAKCNLQFVGGVVETTCETTRKRLRMETPTTSTEYRFRLNLRIEGGPKSSYTIALDTQKIGDLVFGDITRVLDVSEKQLKRLLAKAT